MLTCLKFFFEVWVVIFNVVHVKFSLFHLNSMLVCFVLSQRIKARKLFETNFTLLCSFHSRCCMFLGHVMIYIISWFSREIGTICTIQCSTTVALLVSRGLLLRFWISTFSTSNFNISVQRGHCWRFLGILSKQSNLKKQCFNQLDFSNARKIRAIKV